MSMVAAAAFVTGAGTASAATILADTLLASENSGTGNGPAGVGSDFLFGGSAVGSIADGNRPVTSDALFADDGLFVSLPTGSFVTLAFSTGFIFDGDGDDLFIGEIGAASELADVEVSTDFGETFTFLGQADGGTVTGIDFNDFGFSGSVNAVRITGLDDGGSSPGFDVDFVRGLEGSVTEEPQGPSPVPLPASLPLFAVALGAFGMLRRRR